MLPEGTVGVDEYSRFRVINGITHAIEHYPWPRKAPHLAALYAWDVFMWHVSMIRQHGWRQWNKDRRKKG